VSEFYPTTLVSFYTKFVPFDDYDEPDDDHQDEIVASGIPMQILTASIKQYQPATDLRDTTAKTYVGRMRGHNSVELSWAIIDERTGERYTIDDIDKPHNPLGDDSWVLTLRKVPVNAGQ
jgi:hypothetical protein